MGLELVGNYPYACFLMQSNSATTGFEGFLIKIDPDTGAILLNLESFYWSMPRNCELLYSPT